MWLFIKMGKEKINVSMWFLYMGLSIYCEIEVYDMLLYGI